jgi:hypothetical protein
MGRQTHLGTITGKITKQSSVEEPQIRTLSPDTRPFRAPEAADSGPVICFEVAHAVEQYVQVNTQKLVANKDVGIGFVYDNCMEIM